MTWARFDDAFWSHPKALHAGNEACGAFLRIVCYCCQYLTDGAIKYETALSIAGRPKVLGRLLSAGLLEQDGDDFRVHDFLVFNQSRAQVEASREAKTERQNRWRSKRGSADETAQNAGKAGRVDVSTTPSQDASQPASRDAIGDDAPSRPVPSRPKEEDRDTSSAPGADAPASASAGGLVVEIFRYWQQVHEHPSAKLDPKRRRAIERALKSHGEATVRAAIDGCSKSPFHKGQNDRGQVYDDVTLILRDASKIESFAALSATVKPATVAASTRDPLADPLNVSPFPKSIYRKAANS